MKCDWCDVKTDGKLLKYGSDRIILCKECFNLYTEYNKALKQYKKGIRAKTLKKLKQKIEKLPTVADAECLEDLKDWKDSDLIRKSEVLKIIKKAGKE